MIRAGLLNFKKKDLFSIPVEIYNLELLMYTLTCLWYLFIHLVVTTDWITYDVLDLKLYLLRYYRFLIDQFIKQKISSLNDLYGLFVKYAL